MIAHGGGWSFFAIIAIFIAFVVVARALAPLIRSIGIVVGLIGTVVGLIAGIVGLCVVIFGGLAGWAGWSPPAPIAVSTHTEPLRFATVAPFTALGGVLIVFAVVGRRRRIQD